MLSSSYRKKITLNTNELAFQNEEPQKRDNFFKNQDNYFLIDKKIVIEEIDFPIPIYALDKSFFIKIFDGKNNGVSIKKILENYETLFINKKDLIYYKEYIKSAEELLKSNKRHPLYPHIIKESSKILVQELFNDPRSGEKIKETKNHIENVCQDLFENKISFTDLITIKSFDFVTYIHSVNVFAFCCGFGIHLKWDIDKAKKFSLGAIFHDIGKTMIPLSILNKTDKLTPDEFEIMKKHVIYGFELLKNNHEIPLESFDCITQHHENLSGNGYPYGLKKNEISEFGQAISIIDFYDALTTQRPYKPAWTPYKTLQMLIEAEDKYNNNLVREFIIMLGKANKK